MNEYCYPPDHDGYAYPAEAPEVPRYISNFPERVLRPSAVPAPMRQSTRLSEGDREYRDMRRLVVGGSLRKVAFTNLREGDQDIRAAIADDVSPLTLSLMEDIHVTYGVAAKYVVADHVARPPRQW